MLKKNKKLVSTIGATIVMSMLLMACSSTMVPKTATGISESETSGAAATYPIKTDKTLTYWVEITQNLIGVVSSLDDVPLFQEWQKRTGVPLKFSSPTANRGTESLNVMLASGDLPDMIEYNWLTFPGGPEKAIKDGYILRLNDIIDKNAPNLKAYLKDHPDIDKMVKTDNGSYYAFPFIRGDEYLATFQGPIIRKDWLDELGLSVPTTIDEWTATLRAFKEKKGATAPLSVFSKPRVLNDFVNGAFAGAYGVKRDFYMENGQIKYGPMEKGFKDFLALFRSWYAEGLLDKNIATADGKMLDANIASGATGATVYSAGGGIGKWQPILETKDKNALLVGAPYPVLKKGETPKFGQKDYLALMRGSVGVSANSKNAELAAKLLDYGYSEEGRMLFNFGIEGVSYTMQNGYPKYTDLIMKNPKMAPAQVMSQYNRATYYGPFIHDKRYLEQYYELPTQLEAKAKWENTDERKYQLPAVTPTPEESAEFAKIMADIDTLVDEMTLKIILGAEPLDSFEKYIDKMKSLKIGRVLEIQKMALERYNKR
jgi:putative aldouronate transport system substrate-binding protein